MDYEKIIKIGYEKEKEKKSDFQSFSLMGQLFG